MTATRLDSEDFGALITLVEREIQRFASTLVDPALGTLAAKLDAHREAAWRIERRPTAQQIAAEPVTADEAAALIQTHRTWELRVAGLHGPSSQKLLASGLGKVLRLAGLMTGPAST